MKAIPGRTLCLILALPFAGAAAVAAPAPFTGDCSSYNFVATDGVLERVIRVGADASGVTIQRQGEANAHSIASELPHDLSLGTLPLMFQGSILLRTDAGIILNFSRHTFAWAFDAKTGEFRAKTYIDQSNKPIDRPEPFSVGVTSLKQSLRGDGFVSETINRSLWGVVSASNRAVRVTDVPRDSNAIIHSPDGEPLYAVAEQRLLKRNPSGDWDVLGTSTMFGRGYLAILPGRSEDVDAWLLQYEMRSSKDRPNYPGTIWSLRAGLKDGVPDQSKVGFWPSAPVSDFMFDPYGGKFLWFYTKERGRPDSVVADNSKLRATALGWLLDGYSEPEVLQVSDDGERMLVSVRRNLGSRRVAGISGQYDFRVYRLHVGGELAGVAEPICLSDPPAGQDVEPGQTTAPE